jgi:MoxR-like ATPase
MTNQHPPSGPPVFDIVRPVDDWHSHDQATARAHLDRTKDAARERDLKRAARRFRPPRELLTAVNVALAVRAPLLLTGDPGTGKTQVAWFLAEYFDIELFEYQVRSDSTAVDLRYDFDAVLYLRDAYLAALGGKGDAPLDAASTVVEPTRVGPKPRDPRSHPRYLKPGVLWLTYAHAGECVLLIDEIDKAPRDFPNDLLQELDQLRFRHPFEQGRFIERGDQPPPLVVVTSNGERRLPDPFLRRCVVHHIELDDELLEAVLDAWQTQFPRLDTATRDNALAVFKRIRGIKKLSRTPGAAELIVWLAALSAQGVQATDLAVDALAEVPALPCLIKDHEDYRHLER